MVDTTRVDITYSWSGLDLAGTLHLPDADPPHPAVLLMQGSGPTDRDSDGYFPPIRQAFLSRGLATYAFDKPGVGRSTGDWRDYALEGRADQSVAALDMLTGHPLLDAARIGIWGHSQGGWLAQIIAGRIPDLPFAIASSGPSIDIEQQDLYGCEHTMRAGGHDDAEVGEALGFLDAVHAAARRGDPYRIVETEILATARQARWYGSYLTIDDPESWAMVTRFVTEEFEPIEALTRIRCPYLAVYGGGDTLVPAWRSAEETGRALAEAGNTDATVVVFPNADHRIRDVVMGEFATGYLDLVADWAAKRAGL